jgi:hypothetical protein
MMKDMDALPPVQHLEVFVSLRKDRARIRRVLRSVYALARPVTEEGGGAGPWACLVDPDPPDPPTRRLRATLELRPDEDLWVELAYYPDRAAMRKIIKRVWPSPEFAGRAAGLHGLLSVRRTGYDATVALAMLVAA